MQTIHIRTTADLGQVLRQTRKALNITQDMLSLQTGISKPTIRAIEHGKDTAHVGLVLQLCLDLGVAITLTPPAGNAQ